MLLASYCVGLGWTIKFPKGGTVVLNCIKKLNSVRLNINIISINGHCLLRVDVTICQCKCEISTCQHCITIINIPTNNCGQSVFCKISRFSVYSLITSFAVLKMQRKVTSTANARFAFHCAYESSGMSLSQNFCSVFSTLPTLSHLPHVWEPMSPCSVWCAYKSATNCRWFNAPALMKLTILVTASETWFIFSTDLHCTSCCMIQFKNTSSCFWLISFCICFKSRFEQP